MTIYYKPTANEISLNTTGNSVVTTTTTGQGVLVRIINTGGSVGVLVFQYANGSQYANMSILPANAYGEVIVWKNNTDLLVANTGTMVAVPVAFKGI